MCALVPARALGNSRAMKVAIIKERRAYERRVAASPDSIKRMVEMGLEVAGIPHKKGGVAAALAYLAEQAKA